MGRTNAMQRNWCTFALHYSSTMNSSFRSADSFTVCPSTICPFRSFRITDPANVFGHAYVCLQAFVYYRDATLNRDFFDNLIELFRLRQRWMVMAVSDNALDKKDLAIQLLGWTVPPLSLQPYYSYSFNQVSCSCFTQPASKKLKLCG